MKFSSSTCIVLLATTCLVVQDGTAFSSPATSSGGTTRTMTTTTTVRQLNMGMFDKWTSGGSGNSKKKLDEQWEAQQEILRNRRAPKSERDAYFNKVEDRRKKASDKQADMWAWQTKNYAKGEDPLTEWKKRRESGQISDIEDQYGDDTKKGGIPLPMASFGVGGEFGVGGKFDNGGRFDLRLPYADQGYVDEDSDVMSKLGNLFGGNKKKAAEEPKPAAKKEEPKKKNWPW